ncbi:hypothetical protein CcI49_03255 [Frankia sp. CcI49]|uniref:hypothetical protein n=1 Tax=unclassified Frankia TaxID=2632575 RepID=UPI0006CA3885|nr:MULTISPECIES: hypothetical protein [unclassified Frankia]KPM55732.1 hypothetical protein ACG83_10665 [Frankia sp. R43]ONH62411.1 hypothetical protein CcI49_03255 [Frankia sp. CcI49]
MTAPAELGANPYALHVPAAPHSPYPPQGPVAPWPQPAPATASAPPAPLVGPSNATTAAVNGVVVDFDAEPPPTTPPGVVELFRLHGKVYTIPDAPKVNVALLYLWEARHHGEGVADQMLLERMVGEDGYRALMEHDPLKQEQLDRILSTAQKVVLGSLEQGKG